MRKYLFIGLFDAASFGVRLSTGFDQLRVPNLAVDLTANPYRQKKARTEWQPGWLPTLENLLQETRRWKQGKLARALAGELALWTIRLFLFVFALLRCQSLIFVCGATFLPFGWDLPILRFLRRRLVMVHLGSDSRPCYLDGPHLMDAPQTAESRGAYLCRSSREQRCRINRIHTYIRHVVDNPLAAHFHLSPIVNWFYLGFPCTPPHGVPPKRQSASAEPIRILHAPSDPAVKGTAVIMDALERCQRRGVRMEIIRIEGMPQASVQEALMHCDLVVDELYSDVHLGGLGSEAAGVGVPVLVAGYGFDILNKLVPSDWQAPAACCLPEDLDQLLATLLDSNFEREALGEEAREFVTTKWAAAAVADRYLTLLSAEVPEEWWYDPRELRYTLGAGAPEHLIRAGLLSVLETGGPAALQVTDKPALEAALIAEARRFESRRHSDDVPIRPERRV